MPNAVGVGLRCVVCDPGAAACRIDNWETIDTLNTFPSLRSVHLDRNPIVVNGLGPRQARQVGMSERERNYLNFRLQVSPASHDSLQHDPRQSANLTFIRCSHSLSSLALTI